MLKKIKKLLFLFLSLFLMLLNCVCYGQVLAAANITDYSVFFLDPPQDIIDCMDFTDVENIDLFDFPDYSSFYYQVCCDSTYYERYLNGDIDYLPIDFLIVDFSDSDSFVTIDPTTFSTTPLSYQYFSYYYYRDSGFQFNNSYSYSPRYFYFQPLVGDWGFNSSAFSPDEWDLDTPNSHTLYIECDYFDLNSSSSSSLNVDVVFSPELTGVFNRTVSDSGQKVTLDEFSFKVSNNSNFDIQYLMAIYRESDTFLPFNTDPLVAKYDTNFNGKTYNGSPVYVYVKDEWLYLPHRQIGVITGYAPSSWHMVSSGDSDFVTINFNQVKLNTYQNYTVVVYAIRNDLAYVTPFTNLNEFQVPACSDFNVDIDNLALVYSSQFSILNPAEFDASNNDNSYAFDVDDRLLFNRANGYIDENGEMVIDRVDTNQWVTEGSDDPWVNLDSDLNAWDSYYKNQNTVSSDIDQLSRNFSSFFKFVNKFFSYFPKNYQSITLLGLTSLVVLGIIKVVI